MPPTEFCGFFILQYRQPNYSKGLCMGGGQRAAQRMNHSLVGDAPEHNVIQEGDLLGELHGRQGLETLCFRTLCLQTRTRVQFTMQNGRTGG